MTDLYKVEKHPHPVLYAKYQLAASKLLYVSKFLNNSFKNLLTDEEIQLEFDKKFKELEDILTELKSQTSKVIKENLKDKNLLAQEIGRMSRQDKKTIDNYLTIKTTMTKAIVKLIGVEEEEVTNEADFENDLGFDSLDVWELAMELEKTFNIDADSYDINSIKTVGDAIKIIDEALKAKP